MKTYEQIMKHYWGVIVPMAEAAGINPWECVRTDGVIFKDHPKFLLEKQTYTFALTVLEGKPVWEDSELWNPALNTKVFAKGWGISQIASFTWTPPTKKRTFMLELDEDEVKSMVYVPLSVQAKLIKLLEKE